MANRNQFSACKAGDAVFIDPSTQTPVECNIALQNSCPTNFDCIFDALTTGYVCCGATDMGRLLSGAGHSKHAPHIVTGVCPVGEKAFVNAKDQSVRECIINNEGSCPSGYLCRFNFLKNRYYCCAALSGSKSHKSCLVSQKSLPLSVLSRRKSAV